MSAEETLMNTKYAKHICPFLSKFQFYTPSIYPKMEDFLVFSRSIKWVKVFKNGPSNFVEESL